MPSGNESKSQRGTDQEQYDETYREAEKERTGSPSSAAAQASAAADELIEDVDRAIRSALGFADDEEVDDAELTRRAADMVNQFQQKGGQ